MEGNGTWPQVLWLFRFSWLFEIINADKTWNQDKNLYPDWDKNSLYVIGHMHTNGLCLSPIRHRGELCGPSHGASQSEQSPTFSLLLNLLQHGKSSLTDLQHYHTPVNSIYLLYEEELTLGRTENGLSLWVELTLLYCATLGPVARTQRRVNAPK